MNLATVDKHGIRGRRPYDAGVTSKGKALISAGAAVVVAGLSGFLFTHDRPLLDAACIVLGIGLIAQRAIMGRKPRA